MSPHAANSLVHDLVEMAKAMETLPIIQAELEATKSICERYANTIQSLELKLIDRANDIDTLHAKVHAVEVARDTAETMFLETDDKLLAFRRLVSAFSTDAATLLRAQEPEPTKIDLDVVTQDEVENIKHEAQQGQSEAGEAASATAAPASVENVSHTGNAGAASEPIVTDSGPATPGVPVDPTPATESSLGSASGDWAQHQQLDYTQGQSDGGPIAPSGDGPTPSLASAPTAAADTVADAPASASEPHGPYHGKKWSEVTPRVYNYMDWERGGGSSANFNL